VARTLGVARGFLVARALGAPRRIGGTRESVVVPTDSRVFAVAGVARPDRFFSDVESVGWRLVGSMAFRDHHRFGRADIARIAKAAKASAAAIILTTEKDAMRFEACDLGDLPIAAVPLIIGIEPPDVFRDWLFERLQ
jgi:tetraacyldisaccharide-1-P 4'-kinase